MWEYIKNLLLDIAQMQMSQYMPVTLLTIGITGSVLIGIGMGIFSSAKQVPKAPVDDDQQPNKIAESFKEVNIEKLPSISSWIIEFFSFGEFFKFGPIGMSFLKVAEIIKNNVNDLHWRYKIPLFLIVGEEESGKTSLINSLRFIHLKGSETLHDSQWTLFQDAAFLENKGKTLTEKTNNSWEFLGKLLSYFRPKRPADGIVLTVSAESLLQEQEKIKFLAENLLNKIFVMQQNMNMRLPIYLVITKSDKIEGFEQLCQQLSHETKQQIIGWSSPYPLTEIFSNNWLDEAFKNIHLSLKRISLMLANNKNTSMSLTKAIFLKNSIDTIKPALTTFVSTIFSNYDANSNFIFRGMYFVGKQDIKISNADLFQPSVLNPDIYSNDKLTLGNNTAGICFAEELFGQKIFKEANIAHPISNTFVIKNKWKTIRTIIASIFFSMFFISWIFSSITMKKNIDSVSSSMNALHSHFQHIKSIESRIKDPSEQEVFNVEAKKLLQMMSDIKYEKLFSIFIPQTWFSSQKESIRNVIGIMFDNIIVKSFYVGLHLNAKKMINVSTDSENKFQNEDIFDVSQYKSFINFSNYTNNIVSLEKMDSQYNEIRKFTSRESLNDLTKSIFKDTFEVATILDDRIPNVQFSAPAFSVEKFKPRILENLTILFDDFLEETFSKTFTQIFDNIVTSIESLNLSIQNPKISFSAENLASVYAKTKLLVEILSNPNFKWVRKKTFAPHPKYNFLISTISDSSILGQEFSKKLSSKAQISFKKFQKTLSQYKTTFTSSLLTKSMTEISTDLEQFQLELKTILDQPFMVNTPQRPFYTYIPAEKNLIWDKKTLTDISVLIDSYTNFTTTMPTIRKQFSGPYRELSRKALFTTVLSLLGLAQQFDDAPIGANTNILEDSLKRQTQNLKECIPYFIKIINFVEEHKIKGGQDIGLIDLLVTQCVQLLEKVDALFSLEKPYNVGGNLFSTWDGSNSPLLANMNNLDEVKTYLQTQRSRLLFLTKELAAPIIDVLSIDELSKHNTNLTLTRKWIQITKEAVNCDNNQPGNSVSNLENFISNELPKITVKNIDLQSNIKDASNQTGNYFINTKSTIAKELLSRAEAIAYDKAVQKYQEIANYFNQNLSGRFPFGSSEKEEAEINSIEELLNIYDSNNVNIIDIFNKNKESRKISQKILKFLDDFQKLLPFLKQWVLHNKNVSLKGANVVFQITERPSENLELMASSVMERALLVNGIESADGAKAIFYNGDSVEVEFNWSSIGNEKPVDNGQNDSLSISKDKIKFSYIGDWAMFRLIETHKMHKGNANNNGIMLNFSIPVVLKDTNSQKQSKLIMKITPMARASNGRWNILPWPNFPQFAPSLDTINSSIEESYSYQFSDEIKNNLKKVADGTPISDLEEPNDQQNQEESEEQNAFPDLNSDQYANETESQQDIF